jgi:peptidoglycan/LPS O-acetylase OafA/YrhL
MPGLDGLRAIAVLAVIAYHLGFGWASGGLLGVGVFFTLSGYLITDLLLEQWSRGRLRLVDFWIRRARRLLPALFVMLAVVSLWASLAARSRLPDLRGEVGSAVLYLNNWWQISQHVSYFARFGPPTPLSHLWSLAVEEQFYLLWPWLLLAGVWCIPERPRRIWIRPRLAAATLVLAAASAVEMAVLYHPSFDASRIYDATDTRAFGLLFGAALAMVWPSRALTKRVSAGARRILDGVGVVGLVTIGVLVWQTTEYSAFLYHGGLVVLSIATVLVIASGGHPATRVGRALGWEPLRWLGVRSYAIYLWHLPIIVLTTPASSHGTNLLRAAAQVAATIAVAALSWRCVEDPIRHGALGRLWRQLRAARWRPRLVPRAGRVALASGLLLLVLASVGLAGVRPPIFHGRGLAAQPPIEAGSISMEIGGGGSPRAGAQASLAPVLPAPARSHASQGPARVTQSAAAGPARSVAGDTSCQAVVHIGDSTSLGLDSSNYLPDPAQRIDAQYRRVGVTDVRLEITGATSIVEALPGHPDAYDVARALLRAGHRGCWVIALGTNDAADVFVGSNVGLAARIQRMMAAIGDQPVVWVNVKSLVSSGPYAETNMEHWNQALVDACSKYPNMRVFDWASAVKDKWFIPDGIHYYSPGYAARAHLIADALAEAFPASGSSPTGCLVHTPSLSIPVLGVSR